MMRTETPKPVRYLATAILCLSLAACGGPPEGPEAALRAWVAQGHELAEEKDRPGLVDMISPAYIDARGNKRGDISDLFRLYFLRVNKVALITNIEELNVYGDDAGEVILTVGMAGTHDGTFGFSADAYRFEMEFERDGDEWLLTSARWAEMGEDLR
jgi:predicted small lipoprotein YifL